MGHFGTDTRGKRFSYEQQLDVQGIGTVRKPPLVVTLFTH